MIIILSLIISQPRIPIWLT